MKRELLALVLAPVVGVSVAMAACSGKTEEDTPVTTPGADGAPGVDGGATGNLGRNHPDCPATDPGDGAACTHDGLLCEYGDDFDPGCNDLRVCSGTKFATPIFGGGNKPKCGAPPPTVPPNPAECPASQASITEGATCAPKGTTCNYEGAKCSCGAFCPSYPVGQRACDPDAGVTTECCDTSRSDWHCFGGDPYCKAPRGRVGSPCTEEGASCAIGEPAECGQSTLQCEKGIWTLPNASCPISTAKAKEDIAYVDAAGRARLHAQTMDVRLASYRYKSGVSDGAEHLGFIIEDMPQGSPAVLRSREQVDLYGYVSMAVASLQEHDRKLEALEKEVARLRAENARLSRDVSGTR